MTSHFPLLLSLLLLLLLLPSTLASLSTHKYTPSSRVILYVNKIGPYANPQETYSYYSLPWCRPDDGHEVNKKKEGISIGETLEGHELRSSGYHIFFSTNSPHKETSCTQTLSKYDVNELKKAVEEQYFYQMYFDDLPVWGMVGERTREGGDYIFTQRHLSVGYNNDRIVEVNMTSDGLEPIEVGHELEFSLTVTWEKSTKSFHNRFERYLDNEFFEHQIHWFSIFNAFMMVIFLCGMVALILVRTLRKDYQKYEREEEVDLEGMERSLVEDSGWKQVHGDVFRPPQYLMVFSALLGTGWQLIVIVAGVILFAIAGPVHGDVYEERGEVITAFIVCYTLSSVVAGYTSGRYYRQFFPTPRLEAASRWQMTMGLTVLLLPCISAFVLSGLNSISLYYGTTASIPFVVMFKIFAIWCFVSIPLSVVGTMFGRHFGRKNSFPCRVNSIPRQIPDPVWYGNPVFLVPLSGILPFGSIFIELYFIFTSYWNYKFYYVYGFMLLVFIILAIVTMCSTIVSVYFLLNSENYHWQWTALMSGGFSGFYVFLYALYYFYFKTNMTGLLQTCFYFGYMGLQSFGMSLLCGTFGFAAASWFVRTIFQNVKVD
ncbi:hypothetical protein TrLO_g5852 [Triparma laevis f. longispina]|uniref:Transmembrane 9 superfamily member n=1 Tax=Triparma laevis f. longispina TaxID=1714387 RepID=A0A9W7F3D6_9STRA|nr:hypothetical protein TrLO_g5852 [Triparma laevis f. longispina]